MHFREKSMLSRKYTLFQYACLSIYTPVLRIKVWSVGFSIRGKCLPDLVNRVNYKRPTITWLENDSVEMKASQEMDKRESDLSPFYHYFTIPTTISLSLFLFLSLLFSSFYHYSYFIMNRLYSRRIVISFFLWLFLFSPSLHPLLSYHWYFHYITLRFAYGL